MQIILRGEVLQRLLIGDLAGIEGTVAELSGDRGGDLARLWLGRYRRGAFRCRRAVGRAEQIQPEALAVSPLSAQTPAKPALVAEPVLPPVAADASAAPPSSQP